MRPAAAAAALSLLLLATRPTAAQQNGADCIDSPDGCSGGGGGGGSGASAALGRTSDGTPAGRLFATVPLEVVAQSQSKAGYATYRIVGHFGQVPAVGDIYALFGSPGHALVMPPAFQAALPFGVDFGTVPEALLPFDPDARFDSWLTLGADGPALEPGALSTIGLDFSSWSDSTGLRVEDGALTFLHPQHGASGDGDVVLAQLTVRLGVAFSGSFSLQGRCHAVHGPLEGCEGDKSDWVIQDIAFACVSAGSCQAAQPPPPPPPSPGCTEEKCPLCVRGTWPNCASHDTPCYNYDRNANVDDGTCGRGCMDPLALNYEPRATLPCTGPGQDRQRCSQRGGNCCADPCRYHEGCTTANAVNYVRPTPFTFCGIARRADCRCRQDPEATRNDGSCQFEVEHCSSPPFWEADELPPIHQLNFVIAQEEFDGLLAQSSNRDYPAISGSLTFNDAEYDGVELLIHGGNPQRRRTQNGKASFRLSFPKDDKFPDKHGVPFNYPKHNNCNNMKHFVLRGEWNDAPLTRGGKGLMIRNKLTQDILKKAGAHTPREAFAVLSVNGEYFGFYGLEEHVDAHCTRNRQPSAACPCRHTVSDGERCVGAGFECIGVDVESSSLYKANHGCEWASAAREGWEQKLPDCPSENMRAGECNLPGVPSTADDLAQLFDAIPSKVWISASASYGYTDRISEHFSSLQATLNISNFFLWQMATVVNFNIDTGSHNYYVHGPTLGSEPVESSRLWNVISIDSDWGYGYDYGCYGRHNGGASCQAQQTLIGDDGQGFQAAACPVDDMHLASFYCGKNSMQEALQQGIDDGDGLYLAHFVEFLEQEAFSSCSLTGAADLLMGPEGRLRQALLTDTAHWGVRNFDIDREVRYMKGFIRARLGFLQGRVRRACDASAECSALISPSSWIVNGRPAGVRRPFNCRFASEQQLAALCADAGLDSSAPTRCKQASLGPVCVVDTDPCAREPCQNGGGCSVGIRESQNGDADACGCTPGLGWSGSAKACVVEKTTSVGEARGCIERRALRSGVAIEEEESRWLVAQCDCNGGWRGPTCEVPGRVGPDACGCVLGAGWSKSQSACKPGGTTTPSEAAACGGGVPAGASAECGLESLSALTGASCPAAAAGQMVPSACPAACGAAIVPYWARCGPSLRQQLGAEVAGAVTGFAALCGRSSTGGGH